MTQELPRPSRHKRAVQSEPRVEFISSKSRCPSCLGADRGWWAFSQHIRISRWIRLPDTRKMAFPDFHSIQHRTTQPSAWEDLRDALSCAASNSALPSW